MAAQEKVSGVDAAAGAPRPRWQYAYYETKCLDQLMETLNQQGLLGWELCGFAAEFLDYAVILKREVLPATGADATGAASNKKEQTNA